MDYARRLQIADIAPSTSKCYLRAIRDLSLHAGRAPAELEIEDILDHLAHYKATRQIGSSSMNTRICGIRFYYREVLGRLDMDFHIPNPRRRVKPLSEVMTQAEVLSKRQKRSLHRLKQGVSETATPLFPSGTTQRRLAVQWTAKRGAHAPTQCSTRSG